MNEKSYQKRFELQQKMISKQSEEIKRLKLELEEKDKIINSVVTLKKELTENVEEYKRLKNEYKSLINQLRKMKDIMNQEVYKGRWWLIKLLLK